MSPCQTSVKSVLGFKIIMVKGKGDRTDPHQACEHLGNRFKSLFPPARLLSVLLHSPVNATPAARAAQSQLQSAQAACGAPLQDSQACEQNDAK